MSNLALQQRPKPKCRTCGKLIENYIFGGALCSDCRQKEYQEKIRKDKALLIMNETPCGFCNKPLYQHKEFDLKSCLYSLRGYILPRTKSEERQ